MKHWVWLAAGAFLVLATSFWGGCTVERSRWSKSLDRVRDSLRTADSVLAVLRADSAAAEVIYRVDTLRFTRWKTHFDSVRDTLLVHRTDTVTVERFIAAADSAIGACTEALRGCEAKVANAEQRASAVAKQNEDLRRILAKPRSFFSLPRVNLSVGAVAGVGFCLLTKVC